jgi:hypothetical protein
VKPLDEMGFVEVLRLLAYGTITLADGRVLMQLDENDYLLRSTDGDLHFKWFGDVERYLAWHGATFHHIVVDAEDARAQRIERRRLRNG